MITAYLQSLIIYLKNLENIKRVNALFLLVCYNVKVRGTHEKIFE